MDKVKIWTDGGSRGNPGIAGAGGIVKDSTGKVLLSLSEYIGIQTNNYAEYKALYLTLVKAIENGYFYVEVFMDSKLVVEQLNGRWKVKNQNISPLYEDLIALIPLFRQITFTHVYSTHNKEADALANKAMDSQKK